MSTRRKRQKFTLVEIDGFDARRGYKRCSIPGAGYTPPVNLMSPFRPIPVAADFWRNKTGGLVVRFSSNQPYVFHFEALLASGKPVPEEDLNEFTETDGKLSSLTLPHNTAYPPTPLPVKGHFPLTSTQPLAWSQRLHLPKFLTELM